MAPKGNMFKKLQRYSLTVNLTSMELSLGLPNVPFLLRDDRWILNQGYAPPRDVIFFVAQLEVGAAGNIHLQCALELSVKLNIPELKKRTDIMGPAISTAHIEASRGTREAQIKYCTKKEPSEDGGKRLNDGEEPLLIVTGPCVAEGAQESGEKKKRERGCDDEEKARRNLLLNELLRTSQTLGQAVTAISKIIFDCRGAAEKADGEEEKKEAQEDLADANAIFNRLLTCPNAKNLIEEYKTEARAQKYGKSFRQISVLVLEGPPGRGKSTQIMKRFGGYRMYHKSLANGQFWCNYDGEEVLVLDEFGTAQTHKDISPTHILQWLDGNPCPLPRKLKSETFACWFYVIISTNFTRDKWFDSYRGAFSCPTFRRALESRLPDSCIQHIDDGVDYRLLPQNRPDIIEKPIELPKIQLEPATEARSAYVEARDSLRKAKEKRHEEPEPRVPRELEGEERRTNRALSFSQRSPSGHDEWVRNFLNEREGDNNFNLW